MLADQTLSVSKEHLNIALNQVKIGFWELELDGLLLNCTMQCKINVKGTVQDTLTYNDLLDQIVPDDLERMQDAVKEAIVSENGEYHSQYRVKHIDGSLHWIEANGTVLYKDNIPHRMIGTTVDITEKKDLELLKDELLSVATHELKTPVSAVKGYLQILHRFVQSTGEEKFIQISNRALSSTERITRLLTEIADPANRHLNQIRLIKEDFDLRTLTDEIAANSTLINPDYHLSVYCPDKAFPVHADRFRIAQVLTNLMNNAIKYSPENKNIEIYLNQTETNVKLKIIDHGIGLNEDEHAKVFQKFYRAASAPKHVAGFGIGLFLCSEIIMRHGGRIGIESLKDVQGTCFYFTLPIN